ncbi:hypothetical protein NWE55_05425 [Myroides albus]|uniref:Carboxypeptidase regulatory-like domain-containing protein n=1 Tax=Myroides albus TaxID=2562892 RepID=A0A6I3LLP6_9FLAO|nr:hypothetical protein [Myroides albus]MTG98774.1 hypothetical protein [Myroides albus]UVD80690.1 hypothetical protein NWE55_05425 [Myroides albus]
MKKILMLFLLGISSFFLWTCSKDSDSDERENAKLFVEVNAYDVKVGEKVYFTVTANNIAIKDAKLYMREQQISNPYQFKEEGVYNVFARKSGYDQSDNVTIRVVSDNIQAIDLTVDKSSIYVGETVTFSAKTGNDILSNVTIKDQNGSQVEGVKWTANQSGKFKFVATKDGYKMSRTVEVEVKERPKGEPNTIYINNKVYTIDTNRTLLYAETIKGADDVDLVKLNKTTTSEGEVITFATYFIDVVSEDFAVEGNTVVSGAIARIWKVIIQEENPEVAIYPGENEMLEIDLQGLIVSSDHQETMNTNDIKKFSVLLRDFIDHNGFVSLNVINTFAGVIYDGRVQSMMSYDVTESRANLSLEFKDNRKTVQFSKDYFKTLTFPKEYKKLESRKLLSK